MDNSSVDLSKVISLIMENPKLINEIKAMTQGDARSDGIPDQTASSTESSLDKRAEEAAELPTQAEGVSEALGSDTGRKNRKRLLAAFKPYLSDDRKKAVDSIVSIVDIIDAMKAR